MSAPLPGRRRWWPWLLVFGFLALVVWWVATPRYADYMERSKVHEVFTAAGACRTGLAEFVNRRGTFPVNAKEAACWEEPTAYTAGIKVAGGRIEVTIRNVHPFVDGKFLSLEATRDAATTARAGPGDGIEGWHCGTNAPKEAYKFFPATCRRPPLPP